MNNLANERVGDPQFADPSPNKHKEFWNSKRRKAVIKGGAWVAGGAVAITGTALATSKLFQETQGEERNADLFKAEVIQQQTYTTAHQQGTEIRTTGKIYFFEQGTKVRDNSATYNPKALFNKSIFGLYDIPGNINQTVGKNESLVVFNPLDFQDGSKEWIEFRMGNEKSKTLPDNADFSSKMFAVYAEEILEQGKVEVCDIRDESRSEKFATIDEDWNLSSLSGDKLVATGVIVEDGYKTEFMKHLLGCEVITE